MRRCPVRDCGQRCQDRQFVCARHWRVLPEAVKFDVKDLFNRYLREEITLGHFMDAGGTLVSTHYALENTGGTLVRFTECTRCGGDVLLAQRDDDTGRITLEETGGTGPLVVIGGYACVSQGHGRQYTRFVEHRCVATVATRR